VKLRFAGKRIAGLLTVVPAHEQSFIEDMKGFNFPEARSRKLMEVMGYDKHRLAPPGVCVSDLAVAGFEHLFERGLLGRDDFDAMIVVTQTPDYLMPPTSSVIHGRLGLSQDMLCLDINQGCAGFVVGLVQALSLLEQESVRRVVVVNADIISQKTSPKDRNSYPLVGDAASLTIVERDPGAAPIIGEIKMDGTRREALMIPAGGMRLPHSDATALLEDVGDNNLRAQDHLRMDGTAVFNFVQTEIPPLVDSLLRDGGVGREEVEWYLFHQPNRFMLQKLADRIGLPHDKVPMNVVEKYGNSSGVTIPMAITENLGGVLAGDPRLVCLAGFGVGLTWAGLLMRMGKLRFCEMIDFE
jgi:3-oxoacyl-[acyl-carrier-protein] synthase-3